MKITNINKSVMPVGFSPIYLRKGDRRVFVLIGKDSAGFFGLGFGNGCKMTESFIFYARSFEMFVLISTHLLISPVVNPWKVTENRLLFP